MPTILTGLHHRDKSRAAMTQVKKGESDYSSLQIPDVFKTVQNNSATPIVSQNFDDSPNNQTCAVNETKINRSHQSSIQVRQ